MHKSRATLVSAGFFVVAPGSAVGLIPWLITRWRFRQPLPGWGAARVVGAVLVAASAVWGNILAVTPDAFFAEIARLGDEPGTIQSIIRPRFDALGPPAPRDP